MENRLPEYRSDANISPCPSCGGEVEWTNSRDMNVLTSCMQCYGCELQTFSVETICSFGNGILVNLDYETTLLKYNAWCQTNPTNYKDEYWGK